MSFWENNKGSIKSGGMSLLKGAGKATATVSKAGYGAYKNHQTNKKNALAESEEIEQQPAPLPATSYRDPHYFPPPPHHGAEGRPSAIYSQQSSATSPYAQQPPASIPYGQQPPAPNPYGQQHPASNPYGQQPPASIPYGQQPPAPNPYGQQHPASNPYGQQPSASTPYGQQPPAPNPYGQQPPASTPYGQQPPAPNPYGQQHPASNPYGQQPSASTPYGQQPPAPNPYGQQPPPPNLYGQQPSSSTPYDQQPPASTPYSQQPLAPNPYGQSSASTPYGQQPPPPNLYAQQPPSPTPYDQQPPASTPYGQQPLAPNPYGQSSASTPYGQQTPASTPYGQQPPASTPYGQQPPVPNSNSYGESAPDPGYDQQSSAPTQYTGRSSTTSLYNQKDPYVSAPYNRSSQNSYQVQQPLPKVDQLPYNDSPPGQLSLNNPYHQVDGAVLSQQISEPSEHSYEQSATHLPPPPQRVLPPKQSTETPPPQYSLEPQQYKPIATPLSASLSQPVSGVIPSTIPTTYSETPPPQQYGQPALPHRIPTDKMSEKLADDEASLKGPRPGQEAIQEPKFKSNLMDFDITKFGAPPPRARLTKDEEARLSRQNAEKQRLKAIKENSLLRARETNARQLSPYNSSNPSSSKVYLTTETSVSTPESDSDQKNFELSEISKVHPSAPTSAVKSLNSIPRRAFAVQGASSSQNNALEGELPLEPKRFALPDISKYQPPPAVPQYQDVSNSDISSVKSFHTAPGSPSFEPYSESDKITSGYFSSPEEKLSATLGDGDLFNRAPCPLPSKKTAPPKPLKNQHASDAALELERQNFTAPLCHSSDSKTHSECSSIPLKTVPPPKPAKLSEGTLSELAMSKKKKTAPPRPVKRPSVDSTVRGNHIKELQAKLGKLDFQ